MKELTIEDKKDIIALYEEGILKWGEISKKLDIKYKFVHSICMKELNRQKYKDIAEGGGRILYWSGMRLTDGKPSPVTTYNIKDLEGVSDNE